MKYFITVSLFILLLTTTSISQTNNGFDVTQYKQFLYSNKNITTEQLRQLYPPGSFKKINGVNSTSANYYDSVAIKYSLTDYEKMLIEKNGFMVTERKSFSTVGDALLDIYNKDLPVFVSADVILHSVHASYDRILKDLEQYAIIPKLKTFLYSLKNQTASLDLKYSAFAEMKNCLKDYDLYITMALKLLGENVQPYYAENNNSINQLVALINAQSVSNIALFGNSVRKIDFSQFTPRGHYTSTTDLQNYFKTSMWLGKIELYLIAPVSDNPPIPEDVRRQSADAMLILEGAETAGTLSAYQEIENIIGFFVGEQDNVTLPNMKILKAATGIAGANQLLDTLTYSRFCDTLKTKSFATQKILSQILAQDPLKPDSIKPASAFMLFGQRFVIDSYIMGNVVWDKTVAKRMLPSVQDVLFALGNNPSINLLKSELDKYNYSPNLSALRYLMDSYSSDTWNSTIYNMWLNSIRALNSPAEKTQLPYFMQTTAYWQEKINTQLSSWTELRHDNLLYAKQSYSGEVTCSFPYGYVEPLPSFYRALKIFADTIYNRINSFNLGYDYSISSIKSYCDLLSRVTDTLSQISENEINNIALTERQSIFLRSMLNQNLGCGAPYIGWYPKLFYMDSMNKDGFFKKDFIVADVHTAPTDEAGSPVGWVKHCGTGDFNIGVWIADLPGVGKYAFTGPVMSYYEYTTTNFLRLTDDQWLNTYQKNALRPDFVNIYLASITGSNKGSGSALDVEEDEGSGSKAIPDNYLTVSNYPNPFNPSTVICYTIPKEYANKKTELSVYNITGELVKKLVDNELPAGTYYTRWDGKNSMGASVASGIYLYRLTNSGRQVTGKMNLIK